MVGASTATGARMPSEATGVPTVAGSQWVLLSSGSPETHVSCLTSNDRVAADVLYVRPEDLDGLAAALCDIAP
jgi:hypothetical protein